MELVLILVVALLVLGPKRMPELARTLGRGLGEFRRASSELRQSLALDDLQNELRDGLSTRNTIRRPDDRPAQAGDDLEPGTPGETPEGESADPTLRAETGEASEEKSDAPHPGELPLGNDDAHHDVDESDADESSAVGDTDVKDTATAGADASPKPKSPQAADSPLGNIPVGRRANQARTGGVTDDERG